MADHRIETERLRLRPLAPEDIESLVALDADPEVRRYADQAEAPTRQDVLTNLPRLLRRFGITEEPAFWSAEIKESHIFCGWFHLRPLEEDPTSLDLGYRLRRAVWGRGIATEGAQHLVHRAFRVLGAERVVAHALEANEASRHVLEKVGLQEQCRYPHRGVLPAVAYALGRDLYVGHRA